MSTSWESIDKRIIKIESKLRNNGLPCIGKYFDELSDREKQRYCDYRYGLDNYREIEEIARQENISLHIRCEKRPQPFTEDEERQNIVKIKELMRNPDIKRQGQQSRNADPVNKLPEYRLWKLFSNEC